MGNGHVYIIAGPNGAGKTTFARVFLPTFAECPKFVNADLIAGGLAPFEPQTAAVEAGRLMLRSIGDLSKSHVSFGFETTLSEKMYARLIRDLRSKGYVIHLIFLWLPSVELAIQRVKDRVRLGGHSVPDQDIRRRFHRGLENLMILYRTLADDWQVYDNRSVHPELVAFGDSKKADFLQPDFYSSVKQFLETP